MTSSLQTLPGRHPPGAEPPVLIRPFDRAREAEVRDLFVTCLREVAPTSMQAVLDAYIARALSGDYQDIAAHYAPARGRGFWLALSPEGGLLGTFGLQPAAEGSVELRRMYVAPDARRRGVARTMLARGEAFCAGWGMRRLFLTTSTLNRAAIELYRSAGFRESEYTAEGAPPDPLPPGIRVLLFEKTLRAAGISQPAT